MHESTHPRRHQRRAAPRIVFNSSAVIPSAKIGSLMAASISYTPAARRQLHRGLEPARLEGGRIARLRPELVPVMYPALDRFAELRARVDPTGVLQSDLQRRLGLP